FFLPGVGFFNMVSPPIFILLIYYGFFFFLSSEFFRILYQRKRWKRIASICGMILILSLLTTAVTGNDYHKANLIFVDVGQGDCLHIRTPEGRNILIDGGGSLNYDVGKKILLPYLLKNGVKSIDLAVVTHLHDDHYLGITQLSKNMKIKKLGTYEANMFREQEILTETNLKKENMLYLTGGDRIRIEKDIWIDVLYPEEHSEDEYKELILEEKDENRSSLFLKLYYKGLTVLMTGDLGVEGEQEIMEAYGDQPEMLSVDVLKVGHHGSRYSTSDTFLDAVDPEVAIFQVGKNNFGHPHPTIIDKCAKKGIIIYRNDKDGAIIFKYDENEEQTWHIKVLLQKNMHIKELIKK
ncbi:MAG: MBL fold metallo-hydrolase, partial [Bacillota bacterium]